MKRNEFACMVRRLLARGFSVALVFALCLTFAGNAAAQKKKKNADQSPPTPPQNFLPDEQQLDYLISEMLGAWQIGDIEKLHATMADDISVVNGMWAPPVVGWQSYLASYQSQRARSQQVRMDRSNTLVHVNGLFAWACYQWDFTGVVDGQPSAAKGQTTLVFEKRNNVWLIVHNHTSIVQSSSYTSPASTNVQPAPAKQ